MYRYRSNILCTLVLSGVATKEKVINRAMIINQSAESNPIFIPTTAMINPNSLKLLKLSEVRKAVRARSLNRENKTTNKPPLRNIKGVSTKAMSTVPQPGIPVSPMPTKTLSGKIFVVHHAVIQFIGFLMLYQQHAHDQRTQIRFYTYQFKGNGAGNPGSKNPKAVRSSPWPELSSILNNTQRIT